MLRTFLTRLRSPRPVQPPGPEGRQPPASPDISDDTREIEDIERQRHEQEDAARQQQVARELEQADLNARVDRLMSKNSEDFMAGVTQHGGQ